MRSDEAFGKLVNLAGKLQFGEKLGKRYIKVSVKRTCEDGSRFALYLYFHVFVFLFKPFPCSCLLPCPQS